MCSPGKIANLRSKCVHTGQHQLLAGLKAEMKGRKLEGNFSSEF